jgi:hypothetical protein
MTAQRFGDKTPASVGAAEPIRGGRCPVGGARLGRGRAAGAGRFGVCRWFSLRKFHGFMWLRTFTTSLLAVAVLAGCGKKAAVEPATTGSFAIDLEPTAGSTSLVLNTQTYIKADGQTFRVSKFKFLVSNLVLKRADGTTYPIPDSYFLVDADKPASSHLQLDNVPLGNYTGLSFLVGVDAAHDNGTFTSGDALTHSNDLYWDQRGEYVFLKMAGTSPQAAAGVLAFSIGGGSAARTVAPSFGANVLPLKAGHVPALHISADVLAMFESATPANSVNFANTSSVESGSPWAPVLANNYAAGMFTVEHVHEN